MSSTGSQHEERGCHDHAGRDFQPRPKRFDAAAIFELYEKP